LARYKSLQEVKSKLEEIGYDNLKDKTKTTVTVLLPKGGDREGSLRDIAKKSKGTYNPKGGTSSVGRTEIDSKYYIEVKIAGGGGSGAGSDITRLAESAQCVYNATHYAKLNFTHKDMKSTPASSKYDVDEPINNILTKLPDDWMQSSKMVATTLKKKFPSANYTHHRGSAWVNALYSHVNELNKKAGKPFGDANKWSPADIWMVNPTGKSNLPKLLATESLVELNQLLIQYYNNKSVIGVSLKKCVNTVNFKPLNLDKNRPSFKFEGMTTGLRGFFESGDGYLMFDGGRAQFRTFGKTWQGELKGKNANMGKMSGGPIKALVDHINGSQIFIPQRDLDDRNKKTMDKFWGWYNACPDTPKMKREDFDAKVGEKDQNWFVSKIMTTQLVAIVSSFSVKDKNRFASGMVNYAGSESELSGPYCKVY
jgi:hypothetical protein